MFLDTQMYKIYQNLEKSYISQCQHSFPEFYQNLVNSYPKFIWNLLKISLAYIKAKNIEFTNF